MSDKTNVMIDEILEFEGGYVDHPADKGGATNLGVTQRVYNAYRKALGLELRSVKELSIVEARAIYEEQYLKPIRFDSLPKALGFALADYAVNSGVSRAVKGLQKILGGLEVDGILGANTLAKIKTRNSVELAKALCEERLAFVRRLSNYKTFGRGWEARIAKVKSIAESFGSDAYTRQKDSSESFEKSESNQFTFTGAIKESRRTKLSAIAGAGGLSVLISQLSEISQVFGETLAETASQTAPVTAIFGTTVGAIVTLVASGYSVWLKMKGKA